MLWLLFEFDVGNLKDISLTWLVSHYDDHDVYYEVTITCITDILRFLVVLLLSGVQALVTQFINTTISGAVFGRQLVYDVRCIFVFWIADIEARDIVYRMIFLIFSIRL